ncbi:hypothetical protein tb265_47680 [Gemmatimonadetes bacterium T265]|nr:hypothetical protein tb265_47680 [Gemmatimonadetes bacterium T265]
MTRWDRARSAVRGLSPHEPATVFVVAIAVALVAAGGAVLFADAVDVAARVVLAWTGDGFSPAQQLASRSLVTGTAVAVAAFVWRRVGRGRDGLTVPDVQLAVVRREGVVPTGRAAGRTLAAAITVGGGGSAGSDGPVAVLGAAAGSLLARAFQLSPEGARVLVGAGAGAGIAAAFDTPLAGAFFALEAVVGSFQATAFAPIVLASVVGAVVSRAVFGNHPALLVPHDVGRAALVEVVACVPLLGVLCGLVSALFVRVYFGVGQGFAYARLVLGARHRRLPALLPWAAGALVGVLVFASGGRLVGAGHLAIPFATFGRMAWWTLLLLAVGKIVATAVTLQGGGSGGLLAPSLFVGAATGGALGVVLRALLPALAISPEWYVLVGMGAVVAGATGAPITGVLLVFEMTKDPALVVPLLIAVALSHGVTRALAGETLYSGWLRRRGERLEHGADRVILAGLRVADACAPHAVVLDAAEPVASVLRHRADPHQTVFPVIDAHGRLLGVVTTTDLGVAARTEHPGDTVRVARDLVQPTETVAPRDSLLTAIRRMGIRGASALPVVAPESGRLVGVVYRTGVLARYARAVSGHESDGGPGAGG